MWRILYTFRTDGFHFRKQVSIGPYFADIACHHAKVVIEVDGDTHYTEAARRYDGMRDEYLRSRGYLVLRFTNGDVRDNPDGVFLVVSNALADRPRNVRGTPSPSLPAGGRVPAGDSGGIAPNTPNGTSPLAGEDGRGGAARSDPLRGKP
jgi:very-short-patch-repair endonuclease